MAHKKFTIEEIRKWIESNPKKYLSDDMDYYFHIYPQEITEESIIKACSLPFVSNNEVAVLPETQCPKCGDWRSGRSCHKCQQYW